GGIDPQKQAADAMAAAMAAEGLTPEHVTGPETAHAYEPGARQHVQDRLDALAEKGRNRVPAEIRFTTWMLRYNATHWLRVDAMAEEWTRARVNAKLQDGGITMTTSNVTALHVMFDKGLAPFSRGTRPMLT